jgi:YD repeat-containing protein
MQTGPDGSRNEVRADGSSIETLFGPDPRFGMAVPAPESLVVETPPFLLPPDRPLQPAISAVIDPTRGATVDGNGVLTASAHQVVFNETRTFTSDYTRCEEPHPDGFVGVTVETSPEGRTRTQWLDDKGRIAKDQSEGLDPIFLDFDGQGRLSSNAGLRWFSAVLEKWTCEVPGSCPSETVEGSVTRLYDSRFRVSVQRVNGDALSQATYAYDDDGLLTGASLGGNTLAFVRDVHSAGLVTSTSIGAADDVREYNGFGDMTTYEATFGTPSYSATYEEEPTAPRDKLGRITRKTEVVDTAATVHDYAYDEAGRLESVVVSDGQQTTHQSEYDANGNRLAHRVNGILLAEGVIWGDPNLYGYVVGDPVNLIDSNGLFSVPGAFVGGVVGAFLGGLNQITFPGLNSAHGSDRKGAQSWEALVERSVEVLESTLARSIGLALSKPRFRRQIRASGFFHPRQRESREFLTHFARATLPADDQILAYALERLGRAKREREKLFLVCNLYDVHVPYPPSARSIFRPWRSPTSFVENLRMPFVLPYLGGHSYLREGFRLSEANRRALLGRYESAIALMAERLERFVRDASGEGLLDDTLLIIASDHGEAFGEHGLYLHDASVFQTHLHVPLYVRHPSLHPESVQDVVSMRHLFGLMRSAGSGEGFRGTILDPEFPAPESSRSRRALLLSALADDRAALPREPSRGDRRGPEARSSRGPGRELRPNARSARGVAQGRRLAAGPRRAVRVALGPSSTTRPFPRHRGEVGDARRAGWVRYDYCACRPRWKARWRPMSWPTRTAW